MNKDNLKEELQPYYEKGDCCSWIVELRKSNTEKDKEIERLNNVINELEKFFKYEYDNEVRPLNDRKISVWTICLDKLKELKGEENE